MARGDLTSAEEQARAWQLGRRQGEKAQRGYRVGDGAGRAWLQTARGLGWFSLGLGMVELSAPREVARAIGVPDGGWRRDLLRVLGARELASGLGLMRRPAPGWLWARFGGDLMDLAYLGAAFFSARRRVKPARAAAAAAAVVGVGILDALTGAMLSRGPRERRGIHVTRVITVNRPQEEVYRFWRSFENLPRFMAHLESVKVLDEKRSQWKARGPAGLSVQWTAEIVEDRPSELIAWRSLEGTVVPNRGVVRFVRAPGGRGTEVRVELHYQPPGGKVAATVARLFGEEPGQQVEGDLRRFKQIMETGEVAQSDASLHRFPHPAQPSADRV